MKQSATQKVSNLFTKLASRMVQSIKPVFSAIAQTVNAVKPAFQRNALPIVNLGINQTPAKPIARLNMAATP